jgi:hypothetical protein
MERFNNTNVQIDFQRGCTSLQSHQQWRSVPLSPHPHQHVLLPWVLTLAILIGMRWNLRVVLICICLMTKEVDYFFRCFSVIRVSSVVNSWFSSIPHFLTGLFGFVVVGFLSSLYILDISPLLDVELVKTFFPICRFPIYCIDCVLCLTQSFQFHEVPFINSHLSILGLRAWAIGLNKYIPVPMSSRLKFKLNLTSSIRRKKCVLQFKILCITWLTAPNYEHSVQYFTFHFSWFSKKQVAKKEIQDVY